MTLNEELQDVEGTEELLTAELELLVTAEELLTGLTVLLVDLFVERGGVLGGLGTGLSGSLVVHFNLSLLNCWAAGEPPGNRPFCSLLKLHTPLFVGAPAHCFISTEPMRSAVKAPHLLQYHKAGEAE